MTIALFSAHHTTMPLGERHRSTLTLVTIALLTANHTTLPLATLTLFTRRNTPTLFTRRYTLTLFTRGNTVTAMRLLLLPLKQPD